jgi:predicted acetyltransferase
MRMKEREVRDDFIRADATSPATAKSLADIGIDESLAVKRLERRAIVREASPGLFYFDEGVWQAVRSMRRRMAFVLLLAIVLALLVFAYTAAQAR